MLLPPGADTSEAAAFPGFVFRMESRSSDFDWTAAHYLLPEVCCDVSPSSALYFSSRSSMGRLEDSLTKAHEKYADRLWLLIDPFMHFFPVPSAFEEGILCRASELTPIQESVFSDALCCRYFPARRGSSIGIYLFDTAQTIQEKLLLAEKHHISNVLILPFPTLDASL